MRSVCKFPVETAINTYRSYMHEAGFFDKLLTDMGGMHPDNRKEFFALLAKAASASATPPKKIPEGIVNTKYYKLMADFHRDFKDVITENYLADAFDNLIVPYVNANKYVFHNYLTYSLVSSRFLTESNDYSEAFSGFAGEFITMLVFTSGLFRANESINHDEMIAGIYLFHRRVSHNPKLREILSKAFSNDMLNYLLGALGEIK